MYKNKKSKIIRNMKKFSYPKRSGGTIIDIIAVVVVIGLVLGGVMWVMKTAGEAGQEYERGMVNAENKATVLVCTSNMGQIYKILQMYAMTEDELPDSYDALVSEVGDSRVFHCPEPNSPNYEYIPGQTLSSPPDNILLYEPAAVHNGMCNVLRVSGKVELLSPEELQAAIEQTKAHLKR